MSVLRVASIHLGKGVRDSDGCPKRLDEVVVVVVVSRARRVPCLARVGNLFVVAVVKSRTSVIKHGRLSS